MQNLNLDFDEDVDGDQDVNYEAEDRDLGEDHLMLDHVRVGGPVIPPGHGDWDPLRLADPKRLFRQARVFEEEDEDRQGHGGHRDEGERSRVEDPPDEPKPGRRQGLSFKLVEAPAPELASFREFSEAVSPDNPDPAFSSEEQLVAGLEDPKGDSYMDSQDEQHGGLEERPEPVVVEANPTCQKLEAKGPMALNIL